MHCVECSLLEIVVSGMNIVVWVLETYRGSLQYFWLVFEGKGNFSLLKVYEGNEDSGFCVFLYNVRPLRELARSIRSLPCLSQTILNLPCVLCTINR